MKRRLDGPTARATAVGPSLADALSDGARRDPSATAVECSDGASVSYADLVALSGRVAAALGDLRIGEGDRVGLYLPKSIDAIAAIFGVLRVGAAYVPVDPDSPPTRAAFIMEDCQLSALISTRPLLAKLAATSGAAAPAVPTLLLAEAGSGSGLDAALDAGWSTDTPRRGSGEHVARTPGAPDLAYILYTSGSTGRPKGVTLTHTNATSFLDWCSSLFRPTHADRFASHAPLHFDLSILDVFLALRHGSTLVLIGAEEGRNPKLLADLIERARITSWYSAPSILSMLAQFGRLEERDLSPLRRILFAGEVFPVKHLRSLQERLPGREYYNLYGPTETNVCTWYRIPDGIPADRTDPYPIGRVCDHLKGRVVDPSGVDVPEGEEGELCIAGEGVMAGYWNRPEETRRAFLTGGGASSWYRTGDVVRLDDDGEYLFLGRRDRMVKRRGYRIELGEIEAGLYRHPDVREAAVVALPDGDGGVRIRAVVGFGAGQPATIIAMKSFCSQALPMYMVPDEFILCAELPKTSTDKVDLQRLRELT